MPDSHFNDIGAIYWGLASTLVGFACDKLGYDVALTSMALVSSIVCLITISLYESQSILLAPRIIMEETKPLTGSQESGEDAVIYGHVEDQTPDSTSPSTDKQYSLIELLKIAFATTHRISFFVVFALLNIGMAIVENLLFLFYRNSLGSSKTM